MVYIDIDFEGNKLTFNIKKEITFFSKHTNVGLKKIEASVYVDKEIHENITKIIEKARKTEINSIDKQGKMLKKWKIKNSTYSYNENKPISKYYHFLELEEIEDLHIDSLIIDKLTFHPYSYNEEFVRDALIIDAKVNLSELQFTEVKKLIEKNDYFKVVRYGISDEPREMKPGLPLWSKHKDTIKYCFTLSEKKYFETQKKNLFDKLLSKLSQRISNMGFLLAKQDGILKELLTILSSKKVLTNEEITEIKEKASNQTRSREIDFYQVKDIDEFS
ncbi:MAG: hypothetical protein KAV97_01110 [Actinomycetia bacterium]|nr:hypothetical protein [Actinomycetes bacterium]